MQSYLRLAFLVLMIMQTSVALSCTKMMRWNDDPPFSFVDPAMPELVKGISVDIVRRIFSEMNCTQSLVKMPWARALLSLESGDIDMIYGAYNTPERRVYAHFSKQPVYSPNILYIRAEDKDKWRFESLESIMPSTFRLGVQINVTYSHEYDELRKKPEFAARLHENSSRHSLWKMLDLNRIDGMIADKFSGLIELEGLALTHKIIQTPLIISDEPSFFAFSKKTTPLEFVDAFDAIFSRLVAEGAIEKIEAAYLP